MSDIEGLKNKVKSMQASGKLPPPGGTVRSPITNSLFEDAAASPLILTFRGKTLEGRRLKVRECMLLIHEYRKRLIADFLESTEGKLPNKERIQQVCQLRRDHIDLLDSVDDFEQRLRVVQMTIPEFNDMTIDELGEQMELPDLVDMSNYILMAAHIVQEVEEPESPLEGKKKTRKKSPKAKTT